MESLEEGIAAWFAFLWILATIAYVAWSVWLGPLVNQSQLIAMIR